MQLPKPDARMRMLIDMLAGTDAPYGTIADIGADHGYLAAHLLNGGLSERVIVADISEYALARAVRNLSRYGLDDRARFVRADGLEAIDDPADVIVIAGLGAQTMGEILERGRSRLQGARLLLAPNRDPEVMRLVLARLGYRIECERAALAAGRYYLAIIACPHNHDQLPNDRETIYLGSLDIQVEGDPWVGYWSWREGVLLAAGRGAPTDEYGAHGEKLDWVRARRRAWTRL